MRYLTIFLFFAMILVMMAGCAGKEETPAGSNPFFSITFTPTLDVNNVNTNTATSNPTLTNTSTNTSTNTNTATNTNTITVPK